MYTHIYSHNLFPTEFYSDFRSFIFLAEPNGCSWTPEVTQVEFTANFVAAFLSVTPWLFMES